MGPGAEFDLVRAMLARLGPIASGIGDDCAFIDSAFNDSAGASAMCVSTDLSIENVHFRRGWLTPAEIGYRATTAALSDLAAVAASPIGILIALGVPEQWRGDLPDIADGIADAARSANTVVLGGDTTGADRLTIGVTVLGTSRTPLRRSGARAGDALYVTGELGGPGSALRAFLAGDEPSTRARARFARPVARLREALWLANAGATSAIDISDGLSADVAHLAAASGVRIRIDLDRLPLLAEARVDAASSGEEYELAITAPQSLDVAAFAREHDVPLTRVGEVLESGDPGVDVWLDGERVDPPRGHDHFSR